MGGRRTQAVKSSRCSAREAAYSCAIIGQHRNGKKSIVTIRYAPHRFLCEYAKNAAFRLQSTPKVVQNCAFGKC